MSYAAQPSRLPFTSLPRDDASRDDSSLLSAALWYASFGFPVFPCHTARATGCSCRKTDCTDVGKHPCQRGYLKAATTDPDRIRYYWHRWPGANIAIATGAVSKILVVDVDPRHGGDESLAALEAQYGPLPDTPQVLTGGGGSHIYFTYPDLRSAKSLGPGLDILADGAYVIAPPSVHASGRCYTWEVLHGLDDFPRAPLPDWLLSRLTSHSRGQKHSREPQQPRRAQQREVASKTTPETPGGVSLLANQPEVLTFPLPCPPGKWTADDLRTLLGRADVFARFLQLLKRHGVQLEHVAIGEKFHCLCHPEDRPSAAFCAPRAGHTHNTFVYADYHGTERQIWPLASIYWAVKTGKPPEKMPKPSLAVWTLRMLVDAGVLAPAPIPTVPPLPADAPREAHTVLEHFRALLQCKWLIEEAPSPFSWRFGSAWCGISQEAVARGTQWLLPTGYLVGAGTYKCLWKSMQLFLLGTAERIQRLARRVLHPIRQAMSGIGETLKAWRRTMPATRQTTRPQDLEERAAQLQAKKQAHVCAADGYIIKGKCQWCIAWQAEVAKLAQLRQAAPGP